MAKSLLDPRPGVKRTRDEVEALLKQSEKTLRETHQIHQKLLALRRHVDRVLHGKIPTKRKNAK